MTQSRFYFSAVEVLDSDAYKAFCAGLDGLGLEDALGAVQSVGLFAGVLLAVEPHERCGRAGGEAVIAEVLGTGSRLVQPDDAVLSELLGKRLVDEVDELIIVLNAGIAGECLNIDLAAGESLDALGDGKGMVTDDLGGLVIIVSEAAASGGVVRDDVDTAAAADGADGEDSGLERIGIAGDRSAGAGRSAG